MACPLIPLADRVVITADPPPETSGKIVLLSREPTYRGTVRAVGPGRRWPSGEIDPCECQVGDHVQYGQYQATTVEIAGTSWLILRDADVLARLG